jgi:glucokinase
VAGDSGKLRGGIDLGGTKIQTVVVDAGGDVRGQSRWATPTDGGPAGVAEQMVEALREAAQEAGVEPSELEGVGVGSPGDADEQTGEVSSAKNLPDGKPWLGRGAAGEIGHMVVKRGGAKCPCGRKGCMEAYAGRSAMEAEARRLHEEGHKTDLFKLMEKHEKPRLTSGIWERALDHGDHLAEKLIDRAIEALGTGVASAVNLIDPEAVIIGGGLGVRFGERYMDPLMEEMSKHLFLDEKPPAVRVASLGDLGGAIGASLLFAR